jgi:hypothetical protein
MKIRMLVVLSALVLPAGLSANSVLCYLATGTNTINTSLDGFTSNCNTAFTNNTGSFDWANLNPATLSSTSGPTYESTSNPYTILGNVNSAAGTNPWSGTSGGETVSTDLGPGYNGGAQTLELDGNTYWVWNGSSYVEALDQPGYGNTQALGFPTIAPGSENAWQLGETLLVEPNGYGPVDISLSTPVSGVGFQISSLSQDLSFQVTLVAYNSTGTQLGTVQLNTNNVADTGPCYGAMEASVGATCSYSAPFIAITDAELGLSAIAANEIASVTVTSNVNSFAIGTLDMGNYGTTTPEPSAWLLAVAGIGLLVWRSRKTAVAVKR